MFKTDFKQENMDLDTSIEKIPRIGKTYQERLKRLGIKTVHDLIFHFPHRYEDFSNIISIAEVKLNETACIQGKILRIRNQKTWVKKIIITNAVVQDKTGAIKVIWFNQPYLVRSLKPGNHVCLAGKVVLGENSAYLSNPAYEKIFPVPTSAAGATRGQASNGLIHTGRIVPVYPETEGLSSRWLRYILYPILKQLRTKIPEVLPQEIIKKYRLLPTQKAILQIHFPDSKRLARLSQKRFSFEQLFLIQLFVLKEKIKIARQKSVAVPLDIKTVKKFVDSLPFTLTDAQRKATWQILKDLQKSRPMSRLLQGDVGAGKTVVATIATLNMAQAGLQTAFMAPTEILAKQHFKNISKLLKEFNLDIGLLTSKEGKIFSGSKRGFAKASRKKILEGLKKGELNILIGTHALIQEGVKFNNLALVILDEQHRFGIEQRARLCQGYGGQAITNRQLLIPHLLSMTATPIPRTLALTVYGDLDLSLIDELPKGRKKIITKIVPPQARKEAYDFIREQIKNRRQAFVICPRIEPTKISDENLGGQTNKKITSWDEVKAVKKEYEKLSKEIFPDLKIGMLHGKMKPQEKEKIMQDFSARGKSAVGGKNKKIDILVSTSVVEVGIDIPNATVMMIEGAERFGLAQLHQFRGRVGRSKHQSFCFLFTDSPAQKTRQRLKALQDSQDGFDLAEKDLKIRGPGDFLGKRQSGIPDLAMSALKNISLVEETRKAAKETLTEDLNLKKYPALQARLKKFEEKIHLE